MSFKHYVGEHRGKAWRVFGSHKVFRRLRGSLAASRSVGVVIFSLRSVDLEQYPIKDRYREEVFEGENKMNPMQTHVKILGILHIVLGALVLLIGLGVVALFGGVAGLVQMDGDSDAAQVFAILGAVGGLVLIIALALSVPGIIAGVGLLTFRPWARILTIVLSIVDLLNIPFGTALGVYGLWVLFSTEGTQLFEQRSASSPMQYQR